MFRDLTLTIFGLYLHILCPRVISKVVNLASEKEFLPGHRPQKDVETRTLWCRPSRWKVWVKSRGITILAFMMSQCLFHNVFRSNIHRKPLTTTQEVEVIEFYQRQVRILENLLAERDKKGGQSSRSTTSRSSTPRGSHSRIVTWTHQTNAGLVGGAVRGHMMVDMVDVQTISAETYMYQVFLDFGWFWYQQFPISRWSCWDERSENTNKMPTGT